MYLACVLALLTLFPTLALAAEEPPLKSGVAVHGPLTWGRTDAGRTAYAWPVYEGASYAVPDGLLRQLAPMGFDFIRLTVDPGPLLALKGAQHDALEQQMLDVVRRIRADGLDVLVDFHPVGEVKSYAADRLGSDLFPAYVEMVRRSAHLLAALDPGHIAIEPMNEPPIGYDPLSAARWQKMMEQLYRAVRAEAPEMTVIVTGGRGGSIEGLLNLDPSPFDAHTRFSFHYYLPYIFADQGVIFSAPNARIWRYVEDLHYPAKPEEKDAFMAGVAQRVMAAKGVSAGEKTQILADGRKQLEEYFAGKGTPDAIAADFGRVNGWAQTHTIDPQRIFLGEFDATQRGPSNAGAPPEDRLRWIADVRQNAETRGFHWSFWSLYGPASNGMTLVAVDDPAHIDRRTAQALGKAQASPAAER